MRIITYGCIFSTFLAAMLMWTGCGTDKSRTTPGADSTHRADSSALSSALPAVDSSSYEQRQGKYLFVKYCAVCHGEQGKGDGFNAYNLNPKPRDFTDAHYMKVLADEKIRQTISGGGRSVNKSPLMPSWGGTISKQEIGYLVSYLRTLATAAVKND
jgi:mono/diheme cytochrome c family protein